MLNIIKQSFKLSNKYIVLATPLILFSLLSSLYLLFSSGGRLVSLSFAILLFFLMLSAFLSGWFYMIKRILADDDIDPNTLIIEFPSGVGEYFLPVNGMIIVIFIVTSIIILGFTFAGITLIGDIGIPTAELSKAISSVSEMKSFLLSLSTEQLIKINEWNLLLFFTIMITNFLMMFYAPALIFKSKNPIKAFILSLKDLFSRSFLNSICLFVLIFFIYIFVNVLTGLFDNNLLLHFILTLINFYYIVFSCVTVFNYYYSKFVKIGSNFDESV